MIEQILKYLPMYLYIGSSWTLICLCAAVYKGRNVYQVTAWKLIRSVLTWPYFLLECIIIPALYGIIWLIFGKRK